MPTENKFVEPEFDLSTSEGGHGYIAKMFRTRLKRHDFTTYIIERLAADFACVLARHIESNASREAASQRTIGALEAEKHSNWERTRSVMRQSALNDTSTVLTGMAYAEYYSSGGRYKYFTPKREKAARRSVDQGCEFCARRRRPGRNTVFCEFP